MKITKIFSAILAFILAVFSYPFSFLPGKAETDFSVPTEAAYAGTSEGNSTVFALEKTAKWFNYYALRYTSDAYVRGTVTLDNGLGKTVQEAFFLEPGTDAVFYSFIDGFLNGKKARNILSVQVQPADREAMHFTLSGVGMFNRAIPKQEVFLTNAFYKLGIDLGWGGALTYLEDLDSGVQTVQKDGHIYVDSDAAARYGTKSVSDHVNLINAHDAGRLVQQSYYGVVNDPGYVNGVFNDKQWHYNPVQGGNMFADRSKLVDLRITADTLYIKCRPMDWAKDAASITPSYMEAWYRFDGTLVRTDCRFVDYAGYGNVPRSTQELPAFYCVEPLNRFVYYGGDDPWNDPDGLAVEPELEFWAGKKATYDSKENWVAFTGPFEDSFGIGLYAPGRTQFKSGIFKIHETKRTDPSVDDPTCYTAVLDTWVLDSFKPFTYTFFLATGTAQQIRAQFGALAAEGI